MGILHLMKYWLKKLIDKIGMSYLIRNRKKDIFSGVIILILLKSVYLLYMPKVPLITGKKERILPGRKWMNTRTTIIISRRMSIMRIWISVVLRKTCSCIMILA